MIQNPLSTDEFLEEQKVECIKTWWAVLEAKALIGLGYINKKIIRLVISTKQLMFENEI